MIGIVLALLAWISVQPVHAEKYCNGILTSNNICIGSDPNVPLVIVRCNYYDSSNSDPRCVGVGE
jgi:hypothetical protein